MDYTARARELCRIFNNSSPEAERMAEEWLRKFAAASIRGAALHYAATIDHPRDPDFVEKILQCHAYNIDGDYPLFPAPNSR